MKVFIVRVAFDMPVAAETAREAERCAQLHASEEACEAWSREEVPDADAREVTAETLPAEFADAIPWSPMPEIDNRKDLTCGQMLGIEPAAEPEE
jgi:hypothetical protein